MSGAGQDTPTSSAAAQCRMCLKYFMPDVIAAHEDACAEAAAAPAVTWRAAPAAAAAAAVAAEESFAARRMACALQRVAGDADGRVGTRAAAAAAAPLTEPFSFAEAAVTRGGGGGDSTLRRGTSGLAPLPRGEVIAMRTARGGGAWAEAPAAPPALGGGDFLEAGQKRGGGGWTSERARGGGDDAEPLGARVLNPVAGAAHHGWTSMAGTDALATAALAGAHRGATEFGSDFGPAFTLAPPTTGIIFMERGATGACTCVVCVVFPEPPHARL
jgi:hypothetical protein